MDHNKIISEQLQFYRRGKAGCLFAAHAAINPADYEWKLIVSDSKLLNVQQLAEEGINSSNVSTLSIIVPSVMTPEALKSFLVELRSAPPFLLESEQTFEEFVCLGYRAKLGELVSWVTGFGPFNFLPETRRAPFTEITLRTKPRPNYDWVFKPSPDGVVHLADMNMRGMDEGQLKKLWTGSFDNTRKHLGKAPDLRSAAKTTYAIPVELWETEN